MFSRRFSTIHITKTMRGVKKLISKLVVCPHVATFHLPKLKDKGGNHMSNSIQYELNIFKNDHYFISKHKVYLKYTLGLNLFKHYFLFILNRLFMKNAIPLI